jgi:hypothetical protein
VRKDFYEEKHCQTQQKRAPHGEEGKAIRGRAQIEAR